MMIDNGIENTPAPEGAATNAHRDATIVHRIAQATPEESLTIEVTSKCNLDCPYCFALAGLPEKFGLTSETARAIVSEGRACGYRHLHLSGGEPTLWKPFPDLVDHAFAAGYESVFFNTNAMLFSERLFERFRPHAGKIACTVSLNGPREIHEVSRGPNTYDLTIRGIEQAIANGMEVEIFTTVYRSLLPVLPDFVRDLFTRFPEISRLTLIQLHRVENDFYDLADDLISPADFVSLVRFAGIVALKHPIRFLDNPLAGVLAARMGLDWVWSTPLIRPGRIAVHHNGDITPAHSNRSAFGKYEPGRLQEIHSSPEYFAAVSADDEACGSCEFLADCRQGGLLRPSEGHRDMHSEIPFCIRANQAVSRQKAAAG
ncbi:MAG: radical SAM protein [bacterium]|nr:radical SAM protein [bacterium]